MTDERADPLTDPVGVAVELVSRAEADLDIAVIEKVVISVAGGRSKRRRLARALADDPTLLTHGRSPAPRVVGELLIALRKAGAVSISPPCCAGCSKRLGSLQRRGEDWYCGVCGPTLQPCAACGNTRSISCRDRAGRPRCVGCPPDEGHDPVQIVVGIVTAIDPALSTDTVAAAVGAVTSHAGQRRQLAWTLEDRPELLTGAGAETPVPSVLRLIDELCDADAQGIVRPPCPHCGRVIALVKPRDGLRLCRNCVAKSRAEPCSSCGAVREPATRDSHGDPLCPDCLITDPANQESCTACHRRRPVAIRKPDGPLCATCRPVKTMTCAICGRVAPCEVSQATRAPRCHACQQRWMSCSGCGQVRPVGGGTIQTPLCAACLPGEASRWSPCTTCGGIERQRSGSCTRCTLDQRVRQLLDDGTGQIRAELRALHQTLVEAERPATVSSWLAKQDASAVLATLAKDEQPLTHQALDALLPSKPVEHLRAMLVATSALPARDEQLVRIERWTTATINGRVNPQEKELLHRYAVWHLLRRLRQRRGGTDTTHSQAVVVQQHIRAALSLLDWLAAHDLTLATARQGNLEAWLASDQATGRREAGHFIRWANRQKLTVLELPAVRWDGPSGIIDTETRWAQARWLLHDHTLDPDDRVAGLLVLLYAQKPAVISRLSLAHVEVSAGQTRLRLGAEPVVLPEPLAALVHELVACRRGHAVLGDQGHSPWLFPGGQPGRPISAYQLGERLRLIGLQPAQARSAALFQLATELPAALLARMLGIHITVAVAWQRASAGDWTSYAADVARRPNNPQTP